MLLPAIEYGPSVQVKPRLKRLLPLLMGGASLKALMTADGMLDTATTQGLLLVGASTSRVGEHFHTGLLWNELSNELSKRGGQREPVAEAVFSESLSTAWGMIALLCHGEDWVGKKHRHEPLLLAALRFWPELDAAGPRYCSGSPRDIWYQSSSLHYVLAENGVSRAQLQGSHDGASVVALVEQALSAHPHGPH